MMASSGSHRNGYQRFQTELPAHYLVSQQEERNVDGEVDDAHVIQPRNFRNVQYVQQKQTDQLSNAGKTAAVEVYRVDGQVYAHHVNHIAHHNKPDLAG